MEEYNIVSYTYNRWTEKMGKYTDLIIKPNLIDRVDKIKLVDLESSLDYI